MNKQTKRKQTKSPVIERNMRTERKRNSAAKRNRRTERNLSSGRSKGTKRNPAIEKYVS